MKKLLFSIAVLIAAVGVCMLFQNAPPLPFVESPTSATKAPIEYDEMLPITLSNNRHYRELLPSSLHEHYDRIVDELLSASGTDTKTDSGEPALTIDFDDARFHVDDAERLYEAVYNDHPEFFYLTGRSTTYSIDEQCTSLTIYYDMALDERTAAASALNDVVEGWTAVCSGKTDFDKELYLHDRLLKRCEYDDVAADSDSSSPLHDRASSPFSALCEGKAICGGYTRAMQLLLDRAGIESTLVYGEDHVWNLVFINGKTYHLDATWNDSNESQPIHHYVNITTADNLRFRTIEDNSLILPFADATDENYHIKNGYYITDVPSDSFSNVFRAQVSAGQDIVEMRFSPEAYDDAVAYIQSEQFHREFDGLDNDILENWYVFTYLKSDDIHAITFSAKDE